MTNSASSPLSPIKHWVLVHGWGLDSTCWKDWEKALPGEVQLFDRGYYGKPQEVTQPKEPYGVIVHSYGLHLLPKEIVSGAELLVTCSSFRHWLSDQWLIAQKMKMLLKMMENMIKFDTERMLARFYDVIELPEESRPKGEFDRDLIIEDFEKMERAEFTFADGIHPKKIVILFGELDDVVPFDRAADIKAKLGGETIRIDKGPHAFPFTHMKECLKHVTSAS